MKKRLAALTFVAALASRAGAAELPLDPLPEVELERMIARYQLWDALFHQGRGQSMAKTSGQLGWAESSFLHDYVRCYRVSRDTYWLDKIVDHFDRMLSHADDPDGDGFVGWRARKFSVGVVQAEPAGDVGALQLTPTRQRPYVIRGGGAVTGHEYLIEFASPREFVVRNKTTGERLAKRRYSPPQKITDIPGAVFRLKGAARAGAAFVVRTIAPEWIEYQVHDGMIAYPVAQFVEIVRADPNLHRRYGAKADAYAEFIRKNILHKWERTWLEYGDGLGLYRFTNHVTQRFPGATLPHNQYLALARAYLVMQAIPGARDTALYRDRAVKMLRNFKKYLRLRDGAYVWNYWDFLPNEPIPRHSAEDVGHGAIDVECAMEAARRGLVFTQDDLKRFARTYVDVMWNRDADRPAFSHRVDGSGKVKAFWSVWIGLARADRRVWGLARRMFYSLHRATSMGPQIALLHQRLFGPSERVCARCRAHTKELRKLLKENDAPLSNGSFEIGWLDSDLVLGWQLMSWRPDESGRAAYVAGGYDGKRCIQLIGKGPKVNVLAMSVKRIPAQGKTRCEVTAYYRTEGRPKPYLSVLGYDSAGRRVLYVSSSGFPPSKTWREAKWTARLKPGVETVSILLRNGAAGSVYWDAARVDLR